MKQIVVRTFPNYYKREVEELSKALDDGYKVVMCNTFIVECVDGGLVTGNEYILEKEER